MDIKNIKKESKKSFRRNILRIILVSFIASVIINGGYHYSSYIYEKANNKYTSNVIDKVNNFKDSFYHMLGADVYQRGIIAPLFNNIVEADSITVGTIVTVNSMVLNNNLSTKIILYISLVIVFLYYVFVQNIIKVGEKRYFLEQRRYKNTKVDKLLYIYQIKKTFSVASIMFKRFIYQLLWLPTIFFGVKKYYEYRMIPYILAVNPNLDSKEVFSLSKKLSESHILDMIKLDLSFIGYYILHIMTFGISSLFFFNGYRETTYAEVYINFYEEKNKVYDLSKLKDDDLYIDEYQYKNYPNTLEKRKTLEVDYRKNYDVTSYILFFFTFSIIGWFWEVLLCFAMDGNLVNRGAMAGPWLPIYGYGCVVILLCLKKLRKHPFIYFFSSMGLAGIVEYLTAWYLETFKGMRWWEYDGYFLNINGRVCLEGLLLFGLAGCAVTYLFAPIFNNIYSKISKKHRIIICVILLVLYGVDLVYSTYHPNQGNGITTTMNLKIVN